MALRDWPRPVRLAIAWLVVSAASAILAGTTWVLLWPLLSGSLSDWQEAPWSNVLAHYSTVITAPVAVVCSLAAFRHFLREGDRKFVFYFLAGVGVGVGIGLLLIPATGGFSLLSAPPFAGCTMLMAWLIRRPDRDPPNPPTSTP